MQLFNYDTQKGEDVPDEQAQQALASGSYGARKGAKIDVVAPNGERKSISAENAQQAFSDDGYELETAAQKHDAEMEEKYGTGVGQGLAAFGLGVGRGASFGLSDQLLKRTGALSSEYLRETKEQNPTLSLAGEVASVGLPGLGVLGKGAGAVGKIAGSGVSLAEHAGEAVKVGLEHFGEKMLGHEAEGLAGHILTKYAPEVIGAGVEGAAYGAGHEISEAALGDEELTAQKLIAGAGMGFGIAGGTVAGTLLGKTVIKNILPESVRQAAIDYASEKSNAIGKFLDPERNQQQFLGGMQKELNPLTGEKFQAASKGLGEKALFEKGDVAFNVEKNAFEKVGDAGGLPNREAVLERVSKAQEDINGHIKGILQKADEAVESGAVDRDALQRITGGISDEAKETITDKIGHLAANGTIDEAQAAHLGEVLKQYSELAEAKGGSLAGLQELKRGIYDKLGDRAYTATAIKPETEILKDIARNVKESIEKGTEYVKSAAGLTELGQVKGLNETLGQLYTVENPLARALGRQEANVNVGGLRFRDVGIGAMAGSVGGGVGGPIGALAGAGLGVANRMMQSDRGYLMRATMGDAIKQMQLASLKKITGRVDFDIKAALDQLALSAQRAGGKVGSRIADKAGENVLESGREFPLAGAAVRALSGSKSAYSAPPPGDALQHHLDDTHKVEPKSHSKADLFKARAAELSMMTADAERTAKKIAIDNDHWKASAPKVNDAVSSLHLKAISYLNDALPKDPLSGAMINPKLSQWTPSSTEISKFERTLDAVRNPMSLVAALGKGDISPEQVDAVKNVYPKLYEDIQVKIMDKLASLDTQLPYAKRVQLSTLFDVPGDVTMTDDFKSAMSQAGQAVQKAEAKPSPPSHSGTDKTAQAMMTQSQRIESK